MGVTTFFDLPLAARLLFMLPASSQLATIQASSATGETVWLELKMRYNPYIGTRHICGQDIDG